MNRPGHSCCSSKESDIASICPVCRKSGRGVSGITISSLVKEDRLSELKNLTGFSFCRTRECPVVYYNNVLGEIIEKHELKVRVGLKETEDPVPLCYCFGWTQKKIDEELERTGRSSAIEDIAQRMRTMGCNCERNNPSGGCCLADVADYIRKAQKRR